MCAGEILSRGVRHDRHAARVPAAEWPVRRSSLATISGPGGPKSRDEFRALIEAALRRYEPRFKTVRVELLAKVDDADRTLRFRVDALLHADPAPEQIVFDSIVDPVSGGFEVEE